MGIKKFLTGVFSKLFSHKPAAPSKSVDPYAYREESVSRPWIPPKKFGSVPNAPKPIRVTGDFMVGRPMSNQVPARSAHEVSLADNKETNGKGCVQESNSVPPKGLNTSRNPSSKDITQLQEEQQRRDTLRRQQATSTSPCTTIHGTREYENSLTDTLVASSAIAALVNSVESVEPIRYERESEPLQSGGGGSFAGGGADTSWNDSSSSSDNTFSND